MIVSRGPFTLEGELEMMRARGIAWIVARNSGGDGARAKIDAARELGLPVIMISRPRLPERSRVESVAEIMQWLGHRALPRRIDPAADAARLRIADDHQRAHVGHLGRRFVQR